MKKFFIFLLSFIFVFYSCSNLIDELSSDSTSASSDDTVILNFQLGDESLKTALPDVDASDFSYITLLYEDPESEDRDFTSLGSWTSSEELKKTSLPFKVGNYNFTLMAICSDMLLSDTKNYTVSKGTNSLSFTPKISIVNTEFSGQGNLSVLIRFDTDNVKKVTCGLYTTEGNKIPGYNDEEIDILTGGKASYEKEDLTAGNYLVIFKFYADDEKAKLLASYREYASIINGFTSSSQCVLDSLGNLFSITYKLNGGTFSGGLTTAGSYTRHMETISLPDNSDETRISKDGCSFGGWYDNASFSGNPVTEIPAGSTGDKVFYAKWIENAVITFFPNLDDVTISTSFQTVEKNAEAKLLTASELGLSSDTKRFLGWAESASASKPSYSDGGAITVKSSSLALYAVWSVSSINPSGASDTKDSDGDGLTDWDEINVYFTDPASADTDGDGWTDGKEVKGLYNKNTNTFNPLIADTPQLEIRMTGKPGISYVYTTSSGGTSTESVSTNEGIVGSSSETSTNTKTHNETSGWGTEFGVSWTHGFGSGNGFENTLTISGKASANGSTSNGDSYTYSQNTSEGWSKSWNNQKSTTNTQSKTVSGGKIKVPVRFINPSNIAYTVENVTVALYRIPTDCSGERKFVKTLTLPDAKVFTIAGESESGDYDLSADLGLGMTETLLKYSAGFEIEVSGYKITLQKQGAFANDFTEALTEVRAKTASVYIDWGNESGKKARTYNVSVKNLYNVDAEDINSLYTQPDLEYVFENILHFEKGSDFILTSSGSLQAVSGIANRSDNKDGAWFICHKYTNSSNERVGKTYSPYSSGSYWNLSGIKLSAGDEVFLIYTVDKDGDGLPLNEEIIHGTSDLKEDTDGDGLTDFEEVYGWYKSDIGLDSKYSDENKVYSNPILQDSDGDDLLDYSDTESLRDSDPVYPKQKSDTSLGTVTYAASSTDSFKNFTFSSDGKASLSGLYENIYLNITPKLSFATAGWSTSENGSYTDFDSKTPIPLSVGENKIYIKCTAPDQETNETYTLTVNSQFRPMKNFTAVSPSLSGGKVNLTWSSYADSRAIDDKAGGYVLYGVKSSYLYSNQSLSRSVLGGAVDEKFDVKGLSRFYMKLTASTLSGGIKSLSLDPNTDYCLYLFAYTCSIDDNAYKWVCLAKAKVKTSLPEDGKLIFYAHYVYDWEDQDGGSDPDYYWNFEGGNLDLSQLNIGSNNRKEFDDDDDKSYCFGESVIHKYNTDPSKFSRCTKKIEKTFKRNKDISFTTRWKAWEYDSGSNDDYLGCVTATFTYTKDTDSWKCSWTSDCGASGSSVITSGQRSGKENGGYWDGNRWELHNTNEGEIDFHWDWSWDYTE